MSLLVNINKTHSNIQTNKTKVVVEHKKYNVQVNMKGVQGPAGTGADDLIPRIEALEDSTDGLVLGADPLSYYILAKGK